VTSTACAISSPTCCEGLLGRGRTHAEYLHAVAGDTCIAVWVVDGGAMQGHHGVFLNEVQTIYVTEAVSTPGQLRQRVEARLRKIAAEDVAP
jgi:4-hydroxy-3-methylbut-2-enyl diphosphate reductase IspH